ncbi:hypothetical protein LUZ63_008602 [Rhynchospora breviuscula]|uniref:Reverse transcriptase n=1 Tax=Rhynchospora breviuscula TaxID=2022672 RepID=A0A9Q0CTZ1_9POAL|nr:hypothetical protein LUZ63_008602 [Rhynchospora breviuscula]
MPPKQSTNASNNEDLQTTVSRLSQDVQGMQETNLHRDQQMAEMKSMLEQLIKIQTSKGPTSDDNGSNGEGRPTNSHSGGNFSGNPNVNLEGFGGDDNRRMGRQGDLKINLPRTEFPHFDGSNPSGWVSKCVSYFEIYQIPDGYKTHMATLHFLEEALEWYEGFKEDCPNPPWPMLVEEVLDRFQSYNASNPVGDFKRVHQTGKVVEYIRQFERAKSRLIKETKIRNMSFFIQGFIEGLKDEIRHAVEVLDPISLNQAFHFARKAKLNLEGVDRRNRNWIKPTVSQSNHQSNPQPIKTIPFYDKKLLQPSLPKPVVLPSSNFNSMSRDQMRQLGLCFYCGDKYNQGHKCQKRKLLMLEAVEMEEDDSIYELPMTDDNVEHSDEPVLEHGDISMCTPHDCPGSQTLKFKGYIQHKPVIALLDSGSTHSFIHPSIVSCLQLTTLPATSMIVKTASGSKLISDSKCDGLQFQLQNHTLEGNLRVLEVQGYDIILGMDWIAKMGPMVIDCDKGLVQLSKEGQVIMLKVQHEQAEVQLCEANINVSQEWDKGHEVLIAQLFVFEETTSSPCPIQPDKHIIPELKVVVQKYIQVFEEPNSLPPTRLLDHSIPLKPGAQPINLRPYRFSHFQKLEIEKIIEELLHSGYIRPSSSPFASPILLVRKKDNSWRLCVDYRQLNDITIKNKFPIPIIDDLLDELRGATVFSKIDLKAGYHQIRMHDSDVYKTAFRTHLGHYEFTVMPFGLTNAPATFQALMNLIFKPHLRKFILVFFDDILIYSNSIEDHVKHLDIALQILQDNHLFAKLSKCDIGTNQVEYLGHLISQEGVATDPSKIEAMVNWPIPKSVKQLRGFLGLTGYYRKFIQGYGVIAKPLTELLKKDAFRWSHDASLAFNNLKRAMTKAPVLTLPDFTKPFIIETDASQSGIGAVLMQERRPLAFFSKGLGIKNQSLSTYEKELLAVVTAVQKWRHYLLGGSFVIRTDHISLKHLLEQRINTSMQHKSLSKLLGLNYTIEYKKGSNNLVADALSRREGDDCQFSELCLVSEIIPQWVVELQASYAGDEWILKLKDQLKVSQPEHHLSEYQGLLRYKGRICVGQSGNWRKKLIHEFHDSNLGGHSGILVTYKRVKALFHWPSLKKDVMNYIRSCDVCQITKPEHVAMPGLLQPLPIPPEAWHSIGMDFITGLPKSEGKEVLLVIVDRLTKYGHFIPLTHPYSAASVAQSFLDNVYKLHGLPMSIVSDRDPIFTSKFWQELMAKLGIKLNLSTAYHPQTDGQVERVNQCVETYLRSMVFNKQKQWAKWVPLAEFWYNTNFHSAIHTTPFKALYGYDPPSLPMGSAPKSDVEAVNTVLKDRQQTLWELRNQLVKAQERMKKLADTKRSERHFNAGDWVYIKLQPYRQLSLCGYGNTKLNPKYYGPYEILEKIGGVAYKLNLPPNSSIHPVLHVSQLKGRVGTGQSVLPTLPLMSTDKPVFQEPDLILNRRLIKRRNLPVPQILVQWKNSPEEDATWEDYDDIRQRFPKERIKIAYAKSGEPWLAVSLRPENLLLGVIIGFLLGLLFDFSLFSRRGAPQDISNLPPALSKKQSQSLSAGTTGEDLKVVLVVR